MKILSLLLITLLSFNKILSDKSKIIHHQFNKNGITINTLFIPSKYKILPAVKNHGSTLLSFVRDKKAIAGINGGYFNHSDGFPVSYVFINNIMQEDPKKNNSLITNKSLKDILPKIFDQRSE
ncbi:MAG: hypothetical protein H7263_19195, partial [Candidatus Sericytochromatia bacterium]|nr:hypothetical protein [Candidatus Sericytochromatia bacterium]